MSDFITRNLRQTATYWGNPAPDGWGGKTFDAPVEILCRWEDKVEKVIGANGEEIVSRSVVFLAQDVDEGGFLYLGSVSGDSTDDSPEEVAGAYEIKAFRKIPSIRATKWERKAWL